MEAYSGFRIFFNQTWLKVNDLDIEEAEEIRLRYIDIYRQLKTEPVGAKRTELVMEASQMERLGFSIR